MSSKTLKVVVAEDHGLVRDLLHARLAAEGDFEVLALATTGEEARDAALRVRPDILLLDIEMPGISSFDVARTVMEGSPGTRIIFVTAFVNDQYIQQALELEGSGYVTKAEHPESIVKAMRTVMDGGVYFSPEVRNRICVGRVGLGLTIPKRTRLTTLTGRERTVLHEVARGLANKEIAHELHISAKTVDHHCTHIMSKLDIHDRVRLARFAIREGLLEA